MPRILLVDDDLAEIATVKRVLLGAGYQPVVATNAGDALAAAAGGAADAVLVAPECDGGEGTGVLRALEARGVPAVALSRPVEARSVVAAVGAALGFPRSSPLTPTLSPPSGGEREQPTSRAAMSSTATPTATATILAPTPRRAPTFDMSSSTRAEAADLRQAERELWWTQEQRARTAPAGEPPPPPSPRSPTPPRQRPLDRGWVEEMLRQAEQADYFDLLGLPPDCCQNDVVHASERLLEELALERVPASDALLLDKVDEIRRVLTEAREVLGEDRMREDYRRALGR